MNRLAALVAGVMAFAFASAAQAQVTVSRSPATAPVLGNTVRGSTTTVFSISNTGAVTRLSGSAIRLSTASVTVPTITIYCGVLGCITRRMRVTIAPAGGSGNATITKFRVSSLSGASYYSGAPAEASSITFDLNAVGYLNSATFKLAMDTELAAGQASGVETFNYTVTATLL